VLSVLAESRFCPFTRASLIFAMRLKSIPRQKSSRRVFVEGIYRRLTRLYFAGREHFALYVIR
jgi:hypothetical protein